MSFKISPHYVCLYYYFLLLVTLHGLQSEKWREWHLLFIRHYSICLLSALEKALWVSSLCPPPDTQAIPFSIGSRVSVSYVSWADEQWGWLCVLGQLHNACSALRRTGWWILPRDTQQVCEACSGSLPHSCSHLPIQRQEVKWVQPRQSVPPPRVLVVSVNRFPFSPPAAQSHPPLRSSSCV